MTEVARQKKIRAGHRSSATRLMNQLEEASAATGGPVLERLLQWKLSLNDKLQKLKSLDNEILALVNDDAIDDEIEQADVFSAHQQSHLISNKRESYNWTTHYLYTLQPAAETVKGDCTCPEICNTIHYVCVT